MRGRKPLSADLKLLRNNPGKKRIRPSPDPVPMPVTVPRELTDPVARGEWKRTIVPLIRSGHVMGSDRALVIGHCEVFANWRSLAALAAVSPLTVRGSKDQLRPHPAHTMTHRALTLLRAIDAELGLSCTARARVTATRPRPATPLDKYLRRAWPGDEAS